MLKVQMELETETIKEFHKTTKYFYQIFFQQAGVANTLIYTKLRDRLQQYSTMEMNDKRRADIQRMKR